MHPTQPTEHPYKSILAQDFPIDLKLGKQSISIAPAKQTLEVNLLGTPQILIDTKELQLRSSRSFALIAYLCLELNPTPRKLVAELLWPAEQQPTNDRLRVLLSKLRRIAPNLIISSNTSLAINHNIRQRCDAIRFLALHDENTIPAYKQAIKSFSGDFLGNIELNASIEFEKWLLHQKTIWREVLNFMYQQVVEHLLTESKHKSSHKSTSESDLREALFLAHKHSSIFPWSDEMLFKLVIIYIKKRQPDRALKLLNQYAERISKEYDMHLPLELQEVQKHLLEARIDIITTQHKQYFV